MGAMKDKAPAQGELLGLHTQNPDDWPKDEEARVTNRARTNASLSQFKQMKNSLWIHLKRLRKY